MKPALPFKIPETAEFSPEQITQAEKCFLDIHYAGQSEDQVFDLYLPKEGAKLFPLILYIHEGAFAFGSKRDKRAESLFAALERGYAVASMDYRKSDKVTWPAQIYDVKAAIRHLRANAEKYNLDTGKFVLWGMSAGGYLASIVGVTEGNPGFEDLSMGNAGYSSGVQAVIDLCGACSRFDAMDAQIFRNGFGRSNHNNENSPESIMMGNPLPDITELNHMAAPITYVHKDIPPFFVQHCVTDPTVPVQQSEEFVKAIEKIAGAAKVRAVFLEKEADHEKPDYNTAEIVNAALEFLEEVLETR